MHLIETNKSWHTDHVLDLPLCRVRQLLELIIQEKRDASKYQAQLVEWQTQNIAAMFTVAARDSKQTREIQKIVKKMKLPLDDEEADVIDSRSFEEIVEQGGRVDLSEQPSFEALETAFSTM